MVKRHYRRLIAEVSIPNETLVESNDDFLLKMNYEPKLLKR